MSWKAEDFDSEWSYDELTTQFELRNDKAALLGIGSGLNCLMLGVEW